MEEFDIPIHGLKEGIHNYRFEIKTSFFEYFGNPDLPGGNLILNHSLLKSNQFIEFNFNISGTLVLLCDRCLEEFDFEVEVKEKIIVRFGEKFEELDNNIIIISRETSRFNLSQYIYEFAVLSIPYKKVHPGQGEKVCNPEMIKKLNELSAEENNILYKTDPRWDNLKNLN